jgi:nucleoside 2-deoxyribosyltransferase
MNNVYIASGWFSPEWLQEVEDIKKVLEDLNLGYFSPKDYAIAEATASTDTQKQIFDGNVEHLDKCDWMICNTRNKDMGSIWEAGYFYARSKPIVYFCAGLPPGAKFNLMLSASGVAVCTSLDDLRDYLTHSKREGRLINRNYTGLIE